jgi:hypothetical protein
MLYILIYFVSFMVSRNKWLLFKNYSEFCKECLMMDGRPKYDAKIK